LCNNGFCGAGAYARSEADRVFQFVPSNPMASVRFFPIGDSYTIGQGVAESENWPNQLVRHLQREKVDATLVANPSRTGWTSQKALDRELTLFESSDPTLATVLIGVNDWVQGVRRKRSGRTLRRSWRGCWRSSRRKIG
jgi:lysophospholipase L1-like esterase